MEKPSIPEFYKNKNIFITGGTGFVGIALVEKFLRDLPDIGKLYLLVRPKRGKTVEERLSDYIKNPIFDHLKEEKGSDIFQKVIFVEGDVGEENLGLNDKDKEIILKNVNVVFHSAATLDFEASLRPTVVINLLGTRRVVQLCKQIENLNGLLHVSSAYVNANLKEAQEIIYPAPESADNVIGLVNNLNDDALEEITLTVLGSHVNTYTFTKALAEHEVANAAKTMPTCIVRPSMIVAAWKEPEPGWTNSKNGPQGFMMGASKGVIRRLPLDPSLIADYIPVDIVVNAMIAGAYNSALTRPESTPVYHLTSSTYKPFRWELVEDNVDTILHRYPLKHAIWYPHIKFVPSIFWFKISALIFHFLPAYILDTLMRVLGGKPMLVKLHKNVNKSLDRLEPFIFSEWMFNNKNTLELQKSLKKEDQMMFSMDIKGIKWEDFFEKLIMGVRKYLHDESPATISDGQKLNSMLWFFNIVVQVLFLGVMSCSFSALTGFSWFKSSLLFPVFAAVFAVL